MDKMKMRKSWVTSNIVVMLVIALCICVASIWSDAILVQASAVSSAQGDYANPTIEVEEAVTRVGEYVEVDIMVYNNPGLTAMGFNVYYDTDVLTWNGVVYGDKVTGYTIKPQNYTSGAMLNWVLGLDELEESEFLYATLYFVANDTAGSTDITISYNPNNVFNLAEENITFDIVEGQVTVQSTSSSTGSGSNGSGSTGSSSGESGSTGSDSSGSSSSESGSTGSSSTGSSSTGSGSSGSSSTGSDSSGSSSTGSNSSGSSSTGSNSSGSSSTESNSSGSSSTESNSTGSNSTSNSTSEDDTSGSDSTSESAEDGNDVTEEIQDDSEESNVEEVTETEQSDTETAGTSEEGSVDDNDNDTDSLNSTAGTVSEENTLNVLPIVLAAIGIAAVGIILYKKKIGNKKE